MLVRSCVHSCTRTCTHVNIQSTHSYTSRWSSAGPGSIPPPTTTIEFFGDQMRGGGCTEEELDSDGVGWGAGSGGGSEGSDYLSLSISISVGPIPLSAVPLSPESSHVPRLLLTSSPFALLSILFLLSCLADDSKQKNAGRCFLFFWKKKRKQQLDLGLAEQINRTCTVAMAVLITPDFLADFTSLRVCACVCARVGKVTVPLFSVISRWLTFQYLNV